MTEPQPHDEAPMRPIPFASGYMVGRDGRVFRMKPYRRIAMLPFHDVLREASKSAFDRSVRDNPSRLNYGLVLLGPPPHSSDEHNAAAVNWTKEVNRYRVPLVGDAASGWVKLRIILPVPRNPFGPDAEHGEAAFVHLLMHGPSVATCLFGA